jgi:hypothetical protein
LVSLSYSQAKDLKSQLLEFSNVVLLFSCFNLT